MLSLYSRLRVKGVQERGRDIGQQARFESGSATSKNKASVNGWCMLTTASPEQAY